KEGLTFAGHIKHPYSLFERKGVRYGFCAFAPNQGTMSVNDPEGAVELISRLKDSCDILIVSMLI
ncbi:MAG TPA: capsule biosynthesis protein CapA, partial [Chitinophagaceae bacterium]|nr:capsule biosynthesis protein CapA [Chitinophagaceae bacterium]